MIVEWVNKWIDGELSEWMHGWAVTKQISESLVMEWTKQLCPFPQPLTRTSPKPIGLVPLKLRRLLVSVHHPQLPPTHTKKRILTLAVLPGLCDSVQSTLWPIAWPLHFLFPGRNSRHPSVLEKADVISRSWQETKMVPCDSAFQKDWDIHK